MAASTDIKGPAYLTTPSVEDPAIPLPFRSDRLTLNYFPLRADIDCLQAVLDTQLNFKRTQNPLPREVGWFRAAGSTVFLVAARHQNLHSLRGNYGAIVQNEFAFGFFAEWHRRAGGRTYFKDWVFVNAFVFVDSELSTVTGRSHWGWPKLQVRVEGGEQLRAASARGNVKVFWPDNEPDAQPGLPLLEIRRLRERSLSELWGTFPPWLDAPQLISEYYRNASALYTDYTRFLLDAPRWLRQGPWSRLMERGYDTFFRGDFLSPLDSRVVTVQQFADAATPTVPCYRAVVDSTIKARRFRRGGMLGEDALFRGDSSGGYRLNISESTLAPIVAQLGLRVDRERRNDSGRALAKLRPYLPFWMELDVEYGPGKVLAWHDTDPAWRLGRGQKRVARRPVAAEAVAKPPAAAAVVGLGLEHPANATAGSALVLSLEVKDKRALQKTLSDYHVAGEPGDRVHVIVGFGRPSGAQKNDAVAAKAFWHVAFCVPVRVGSQDKLVVPFEYLNQSRAAMTAREVQGRMARFAEFVTPSETWPTRGVNRAILVMRLELLSKVGVGAFAEQETLLELRSAQALDWSAAGAGTSKHDFEVLGLKQFRDAEGPQYASYQAGVSSSVHVALESEGQAATPLELLIHRYPSYDVVSALGLAEDVRPLSAPKEHTLTGLHAVLVSGSYEWGTGTNEKAQFTLRKSS